MELLNPLIFIQGILWSTLLFRTKPLTTSVFITISAAAVLNYLVTNQIIPANIFYSAAIIFLAFLINPLAYLYYKNKVDLAANTNKRLLHLSLPVVMTLTFLFITSSHSSSVLIAAIYVLSLVTYLCLAVFQLYRYIKLKPYAGGFFDLQHNRFLIFSLFTVFVIAVSFLFAMVMSLDLDGSSLPEYDLRLSTDNLRLLQIPLALLLFYSGYHEVTFSPMTKRPFKPLDTQLPKADNAITERIKYLIKTENVYLDPELTLDKLAEQLQIHPAELSMVLNKQMGTSFNGMINSYRVEAVKEKLKNPDNRLFTFMAIAYECGFNSKSTFYRTFKDFTGVSPKEYLRSSKTQKVFEG